MTLFLFIGYNVKGDVMKLLLIKMIHFVLKKMGRGGSLPGTIALKLDKDILKKFKMPKKVIIVTGTN